MLESIEGYSITDEQKFRMRIVRSHLNYIENLISEIDSAIGTMVAKHESLISLLCTIPGVDRNSAITIISEIGNDMSQFSSSKRLCCWAGLTPGNNESAGKKKSVRITRAGVYLKPALVQVAHAAVKATDNSYYRLKYEQISKRRGKKRAIIMFTKFGLLAFITLVPLLWVTIRQRKLFYPAILVGIGLTGILLGGTSISMEMILHASIVPWTAVSLVTIYQVENPYIIISTISIILVGIIGLFLALRELYKQDQ